MNDLCVQPHTLVNPGYMLSLQVKFYILKRYKAWQCQAGTGPEALNAEKL